MSASNIAPTPSCKEGDTEVIYRNIEASRRLRFGSATANPLFDPTPRGRNNAQRDKLFILIEFLTKGSVIIPTVEFPEGSAHGRPSRPLLAPADMENQRTKGPFLSFRELRGGSGSLAPHFLSLLTRF